VPSDASPFACRKDGLAVVLRVTPRAGRDRIDGMIDESEGRKALKVYVTAAPDDGQANAAVIALLAKAWHIPKSHLTIAQGAASRHQTVHIRGDGPALKQRLDTWLRETHG
jgi:hypothetical protein